MTVVTLQDINDKLPQEIEVNIVYLEAVTESDVTKLRKEVEKNFHVTTFDVMRMAANGLTVRFKGVYEDQEALTTAATALHQATPAISAIYGISLTNNDVINSFVFSSEHQKRYGHTVGDDWSRPPPAQNSQGRVALVLVKSEGTLSEMTKKCLQLPLWREAKILDNQITPLDPHTVLIAAELPLGLNDFALHRILDKMMTVTPFVKRITMAYGSENNVTMLSSSKSPRALEVDGSELTIWFRQYLRRAENSKPNLI